MSNCSIEGCDKPTRARTWCSTHYMRWQRQGDPTACTTNRHVSAVDRFWMKVEQGPGCWTWTGAKIPSGYGAFNDGAGSEMAHRYSYELTRGPIAEGLHLDHICHNRLCVNPGHLRQVTRKQNMENRIGAHSNSSTGVRGVHFDKKTNRYIARVGHNGRKVEAGKFKTLSEAADAVVNKRNELFTHNDADRINS